MEKKFISCTMLTHEEWNKLEPLLIENRIKDYLKNNGLDYNELIGKAVAKELYH